MELFRRTVRIVDDVVPLQRGNAGRIKPNTHRERPEDEYDHWCENWTWQCLSLLSQVFRETNILVHAVVAIDRERPDATSRASGYGTTQTNRSRRGMSVHWGEAVKVTPPLK